MGRPSQARLERRSMAMSLLRIRDEDRQLHRAHPSRRHRQDPHPLRTRRRAAPGTAAGTPAGDPPTAVRQRYRIRPGSRTGRARLVGRLIDAAVAANAAATARAVGVLASCHAGRLSSISSTGSVGAAVQRRTARPKARTPCSSGTFTTPTPASRRTPHATWNDHSESNVLSVTPIYGAGDPRV